MEQEDIMIIMCVDCNIPESQCECGNDDCQSRTATRMSGEAWNTRGPREFTKNEIWEMFRAIETYIDIEPDASQKQFLQKLSNKIRLWVGSKR